ncbi:hypothetical protein LCGC14_1229230 [marine sediment metagenome]|uniref:Uncharacterized protein n=1 Tax=marine sediment metagenome TaxID=412755 RepID=A0A0F9PDE1_9ZZZZ
MTIQLITGHWHGNTGDTYLQLGGIPRFFKMWGLEIATPAWLEWAPGMAADDLTTEGIYRDASGGALEDLAFGYGVSPYYGGDVLTSTLQPSVVYGHDDVNFIERDDTDYRFLTDGAAGIFGDASSADIDTWTLDTAGTPSGHFNSDAVGTYINDGSLIRIQSRDRKHVYEAHIVNSAISADGSASDEIVLSWAVPTGSVEFIGGFAGYKPTPVGNVTKPGLLINENVIAASSMMVAFMAWMDG